MVSVQLKSCYGNNSSGRGGCSEIRGTTNYELASESVKCDTSVASQALLTKERESLHGPRNEANSSRSCTFNPPTFQC